MGVAGGDLRLVSATRGGSWVSVCGQPHTSSLRVRCCPRARPPPRSPRRPPPLPRWSPPAAAWSPSPPAPPRSPGSPARSAAAPRARCGPGSILRVRGKTLSRTDQVVFMGVDGEADNVAATPVEAPQDLGRRARAVRRRGRAGRGRGSRRRALGPVGRRRSRSRRRRSGAAPTVEFAVRAPRFYLGSAQPAALTYVVHGAAPVDVAVELVRAADGVVIAHWDAPQVAPETPQVVTWDGAQRRRGAAARGPLPLPGHRGRRARDGWRRRAASRRPTRPRSSSPTTGSRSSAPYRFGSGVAGFGGGRGHQGNDVFAKCGTPLVAAQGGRVEYAGYHGRAGNYLVIDTPDGDHAYMHLRDVALVKTDDIVVHRAAARLRRRHRLGERVPPALRDLDRAGLVQRRLGRSTRCRS